MVPLIAICLAIVDCLQTWSQVGSGAAVEVNPAAVAVADFGGLGLMLFLGVVCTVTVGFCYRIPHRAIKVTVIILLAIKGLVVLSNMLQILGYLTF